MKLYRKMFVDADGKPRVGDGRNMLGVRPADPTRPRKASDVSAVIGSDPVLPGEGLSTFDSPTVIPPQVQGEMWVIETDDLPAELTFHQRGKKWHFHIEARQAVTLDNLQQLLAGTHDLWERDDGGSYS